MKSGRPWGVAPIPHREPVPEPRLAQNIVLRGRRKGGLEGGWKNFVFKPFTAEKRECSAGVFPAAKGSRDGVPCVGLGAALPRRIKGG